jgi:hypothetical protein
VVCLVVKCQYWCGKRWKEGIYFQRTASQNDTSLLMIQETRALLITIGRKVIYFVL